MVTMVDPQKTIFCYLTNSTARQTRAEPVAGNVSWQLWLSAACHGSIHCWQRVMKVLVVSGVSCQLYL